MSGIYERGDFGTSLFLKKIFQKDVFFFLGKKYIKGTDYEFVIYKILYRNTVGYIWYNNDGKEHIEKI